MEETDQNNVSVSSTTSSSNGGDTSKVKSKQAHEQLKPLPQESRCDLSWAGLEYFIPLSAEKRSLIKESMSTEQMALRLAAGDEDERGYPLPTVVRQDKKLRQQILFPSSGEVKRTELVAIMGPTGSGKTTLLNLLAQRAKLASQDCAMGGSVSINGQTLQRQEFSKVGAYVQQDDGLMEILNAKEIFRFACQIRLGLSHEETEKRVSDTVQRLDLQECQDQQIGGYLKRGISGGERKRVSIGYELITEPSILLLDEPTSGLDSQNAKRVVRQLRLEAERGLAVLATIHQPSSEVFQMFDRVILLSEGRTIYNGRPSEAAQYFMKAPLDYKIGLYCNPADKLISLASNASKAILDSDGEVPLIFLETLCRKETENELKASQQNQDSKNQLDISKVTVLNTVSFYEQFKIILHRTNLQIKRVPLALMITIINGIVQGCLQAGMFSEVINVEFSWRDKRINQKSTLNMLGLAFLAASDQFIMMSMAQVLQIPLHRPIFEREIGNRMYSPTAFYFATTLAGIWVFFLYPMFTGLISYWFFGFANPDLYGLLDWTFALSLPAFLGSLWGFAFGTFFSSEFTALQFNLVFIILFNLGAGQNSNIGKGANYFGKFISAISPIRYGTEMLMSRVLKGHMAEKAILINLGYTTGDGNCVLTMVAIAVFLFLAGWLNLLRTNSAD